MSEIRKRHSEASEGNPDTAESDHVSCKKYINNNYYMRSNELNTTFYCWTSN